MSEADLEDTDSNSNLNSDTDDDTDYDTDNDTNDEKEKNEKNEAIHEICNENELNNNNDIKVWMNKNGFELLEETYKKLNENGFYTMLSLLSVFTYCICMDFTSVYQMLLFLLLFLD